MKAIARLVTLKTFVSFKNIQPPFSKQNNNKRETMTRIHECRGTWYVLTSERDKNTDKERPTWDEQIGYCSVQKFAFVKFKWFCSIFGLVPYFLTLLHPNSRSIYFMWILLSIGDFRYEKMLRKIANKERRYFAAETKLNGLLKSAEKLLPETAIHSPATTPSQRGRNSWS
jgi:hypothetical protein